MSGIQGLVEVLSPPDQPLYASELDWQSVERRYGFSVPNDFREFVSLYGSGIVDGFLWVLNPFCVNPNVNFETSLYLIESYSQMKSDFPEDYPRPDFPNEGSFFPWAITDNGETISWILHGQPNEWPVSVQSVDQADEEAYACGAVDFLQRILRREVRSRILPCQFPSDAPSFVSGS